MACPKLHAYQFAVYHKINQPHCQLRWGEIAPISSSATQHLVDPDDVEWMHPHAHVEGVLAGSLGNIFVGTDTGSFKCFRWQLLVFVGNQMAAEGEFVDWGTFPSEIENANLQKVRHVRLRKIDITYLGIVDTTVIPWLRVWLVLAIAVAASGTTAHFYLYEKSVSKLAQNVIRPIPSPSTPQNHNPALSALPQCIKTV